MSRKLSPGRYKSTKSAIDALSKGAISIVFRGDCFDLLKRMPSASVDLTISSPPYCMGMEYEKENSVEDFISAHKIILPEIVRVTKPGGSICWQVGYHVSKRLAYPLDYAVFSILEQNKEIAFRNRIIWTFAHGLHNNFRFDGRHETLLWYTKGSDYFFDLDAVRVAQKYPGKRAYKGPTKGEYSGNPLGKNPGDVWEIPNIKGNHIEKTGHPCQFPVALVQRAVRSMCPADGIVFDPFMGSGSTGVAAAVEGRRFLGSELNADYSEIGSERIRRALDGNALFRPIDKPIYSPGPNSKLTRVPPHFRVAVE